MGCRQCLPLCVVQLKGKHCRKSEIRNVKRDSLTQNTYKCASQGCPNASSTPITAMGGRQCLPLSVVQLKVKHCRKPHCRNGVVDTFGRYGLGSTQKSGSPNKRYLDSYFMLYHFLRPSRQALT